MTTKLANLKILLSLLLRNGKLYRHGTATFEYDLVVPNRDSQLSSFTFVCLFATLLEMLLMLLV